MASIVNELKSLDLNIESQNPTLNQKKCMICLEILLSKEKSEIATISACSHSYHQDCLDCWCSVKIELNLNYSPIILITEQYSR